MPCWGLNPAKERNNSMANYKTFKIQRIVYADSAIGLHLGYGECLDYRDGKMSVITCRNTYPFNAYQAGDWIEIDLDWVRSRNYGEQTVESNSEVVRFYLPSPNRNPNAPVPTTTNFGHLVPSSSSTNVISSSGSSSELVISPGAVSAMNSPGAMEIARRMSQMVDETGKEYEYKIEVEAKDGKKISHSLICRKG